MLSMPDYEFDCFRHPKGYKILGALYFLFLLLRLPEILFLVLWWGTGTSLLPRRVRVILTQRAVLVRTEDGDCFGRQESLALLNSVMKSAMINSLTCTNHA